MACVTVTVTVAVWVRLPLIPVTVTTYVPATVESVVPIVSVALPELVIDVGLSVAVIPAGALAVNATVPLKPPSELTVIVLVPDDPWRMVMLVGLAVSVKSCTLTVTIVVCDSDPLVPVTVTVYVPPIPLHCSRLVPDPVTLVGLRVHVSPLLGEIDVARVTVPVNPLTAVIVIVELAFTPGVVLTVVGLANIWKSVTWTNIILVAWDSEPLVPVTVTV